MVSPKDFGSDGAFDREVDKVFGETVGLLHIALVAHYEVGELNARQLERELQLWFRRFCRDSRNASPQDCRAYLLLQCCRMARESLEGSVKSGVCQETPRLRRVLARDPAATADRLSRTLSLLDSPG